MLTCPSVLVLWEGDGDSDEVQCVLTGPHAQHEAEVEGTAVDLEHDIEVQVRARVCWPVTARVEA